MPCDRRLFSIAVCYRLDIAFGIGYVFPQDAVSCLGVADIVWLSADAFAVYPQFNLVGIGESAEIKAFPGFTIPV